MEVIDTMINILHLCMFQKSSDWKLSSMLSFRPIEIELSNIVRLSKL